MRRDPTAIIAAHRMDPTRRELYVEGPRDVVFMRWIMSTELANNARIIDSDFVAIDQPMGGARGRLVEFGRQLQGGPASIRILVDADYDRILGVVRTNVEWTDKRDLESYLLNPICVDKVLRLGLHRDDLDSLVVLKTLLENGRRLGLLRLASLLHDWQFPFQDTKLNNYLFLQGSQIILDFDALVQTLLGKTRGRKYRPVLNTHITEMETRFAGASDLDLTHGKDAVQMIGCVCHHCGVNRLAAEPMFWTSFERGLIASFPVLTGIYEFLRAA